MKIARPPNHAGLWVLAAVLLTGAPCTFPLVHVDANMVHSWLASLSAALTAGCSCGAAYATTLSGRPAGFIPSILFQSAGAPSSAQSIAAEALPFLRAGGSTHA